jgi:hypothetical protein
MKTLKGSTNLPRHDPVSDGHRTIRWSLPRPSSTCWQATGFAIAVDKVWTDLEGTLAKNAGKKARTARAAGGA